MEIWLQFHDWSSALQQMAADATRTPDAPGLLNLQGAVLVQAGQPADALKVLDHLLGVTNLPAGRINHAAAQLLLGNYPAATREFQNLVNAAGETENVARWQATLARSATSHAPVPELGTSLTDSPSGPVLVPMSRPPDRAAK